MKWLFTLIIVTIIFIIDSFYIPQNLVFAFRWMTISMSIISFIYYFIIVNAAKKNSGKMIVRNLAAIAIKFMLSFFSLIIYIFFFGIKNNIELIYFVIAYIIYSVISFGFSYFYVKK